MEVGGGEGLPLRRRDATSDKDGETETAAADNNVRAAKVLTDETGRSKRGKSAAKK